MVWMKTTHRLHEDGLLRLRLAFSESITRSWAMAADITVPFLHTAVLVTSAAGFAVLLRLLPVDWSPWKVWGVAALGGALLGGGAAWIGLVPWRGELHLAAYAGFLLAGFGLAWWLLQRRAAQLGLQSRQMSDAVLLALVLGIVGARARYVWERWDALHVQHGDAVWSVALDLDRGGAVWYGGVLLATLGIIVLFRRWRAPLLTAADVVLPAVLMGLAIGRVGCFVNGCCFGAPTDLPWAVACPRPPHGPVHPTQLYEALMVVALGAGLWWWWTPRRLPGLVAALAMMGYGIWRFANESLRGDHDAFTVWPVVGRITTSQGTSLLLAAGGLAMLVWCWWRSRRSSEVG